MCHKPRPTFVPSGILIHPAIWWPQQTRAKSWGGCAPFCGSWVPFNNIAWAEAYFRTKWYPDASSRLARIDMGRMFFFRRGGTGFPSSTMWPGLRPTQVPSWSIQPFGHNRHGPKIGVQDLVPHLTQGRLGRGLPPYQVASWSIQSFGHSKYGPKIGGCAPLRQGQLGLHLTQCGQGWSLPACRISSWSIQPFGHNAPTSQTGQAGGQTTVW